MIATSKGWWEDINTVEFDGETDVFNDYIYATKLALISSEVSEAIEDLRADDMTHLGEELADIAIRLFDFSHQLEINLEREIDRKMEINKGRPYKHGKRF
jgi:NTP pyrophosphatase (non-canonical NTP hydrolase)